MPVFYVPCIFLNASFYKMYHKNKYFGFFCAQTAIVSQLRNGVDVDVDLHNPVMKPILHSFM